MKKIAYKTIYEYWCKRDLEDKKKNIKTMLNILGNLKIKINNNCFKKFQKKNNESKMDNKNINK